MTNVMTANFHGTVLYGTHMGNAVFVALKPIVEAMGLEWSAQFRRVQRDPVLKEGIAIMAIPSGRGQQESVGLRLDLLHGWLFTISALRIKSAEIRARVILFQRECYEVLAEHFLGQKITNRQSASYERRSIDMVREARILFGYRAGAQTWRERGLPIVPGMAETFRQLELFDRSSM
jgi:hypothetical protein